jgi:hypothetical protein
LLLLFILSIPKVILKLNINFCLEGTKVFHILKFLVLIMLVKMSTNI